MDERRRYPRHAVPPDCFVRFPEGSGGLRDLSLGGFLAEDKDPDPIPLGTGMDLRLHLGGESLECRGEVRRTEPGRSLAIEFTDLAGRNRYLVHSYLAGLSLRKR